jgi:hypothetical protein
VSDIKALHEAATPAPWHQQPMYTSHRSTSVWGEGSEPVCECGHPIRKAAHPQDVADAAFIVALRNAYADGTLVERTPVGGERMSEERPEAYSIGFDEGNGDEACFTLFHDGEVQIYAYGKTARLLHDAFIAYATSLERKPQYDGKSIANPVEFADLLAREFVTEGDMRSFRASQTDSEETYIRLWAHALDASRNLCDQMVEMQADMDALLEAAEHYNNCLRPEKHYAKGLSCDGCDTESLCAAIARVKGKAK